MSSTQRAAVLADWQAAITRAKAEAGIDQWQQLATLIGVPPKTVSLWSTGRSAPPTEEKRRQVLKQIRASAAQVVVRVSPDPDARPYPGPPLAYPNALEKSEALWSAIVSAQETSERMAEQLAKVRAIFNAPFDTTLPAADLSEMERRTEEPSLLGSAPRAKAKRAR
jgi:transcriptional regulator with XRE-family HTH domain